MQIIQQAPVPGETGPFLCGLRAAIICVYLIIRSYNNQRGGPSAARFKGGWVMPAERKKKRVTDADGCQVHVIHLERLDRAREESPGKGRLESMARLFKAMGEPTRLSILAALAGGEMCVCDLAAFSGASESAVSHQLRRLKDLGLLKRRREAQSLYYFLDDGHVAELIDICRMHVLHKEP